MTEAGEDSRRGPRVAMTFSIAPLSAVEGNAATVLGESILVILGMFFPPVICKKANVVVTELVQNVLENVSEPSSEMTLALSLDAGGVDVAVTNAVTPEQRAAVEGRVRELATSPDPKKLFAETLRARRVHRLKGGIGLMRLVAENRFRLSTSSTERTVTVHARFDATERT